MRIVFIGTVDFSLLSAIDAEAEGPGGGGFYSIPRTSSLKRRLSCKKLQAWGKSDLYVETLNPIHGEERVLELPLKRPSQLELEKLKNPTLNQPSTMEPARGYQPVPERGL